MKQISGKDFTRALERNGWMLARIQSSHHIYRKAGIRAAISVPVHGNKNLKIGLLKAFLRTAGLSEEDL